MSFGGPHVLFLNITEDFLVFFATYVHMHLFAPLKWRPHTPKTGGSHKKLSHVGEVKPDVLLKQNQNQERPRDFLKRVFAPK